MDWAQWLKEECVITTTAISVTTAFQQFLPRDPYRFMHTYPSTGNAAIVYQWGSITPTVGVVFNPTAQTVFFATSAEMGRLITEPFWIRSTGSTQSLAITSCSYNPNRKEIYDEWCKWYLSKRGS